MIAHLKATYQKRKSILGTQKIQFIWISTNHRLSNTQNRKARIQTQANDIRYLQ